MPVSVLALMEHIMPQIMKSYTAAVEAILDVALQLKPVPPGKDV